MNELAYNDEALAQVCEEWAKEHLDPNFEFRPYQLNTIVTILKNQFSNVKTQVIEAPTGFGKSITAFIVCGVLWDIYGKESYILVSDLSLFEQYEKDIERYKLPWGHLKGKDNYLCSRNGHSVNTGDCSVNMIGLPILKDPNLCQSKGYQCANTCKYVRMRALAEDAPVTIMTYQMWFIARNYMKDQLCSGNENEAPFKLRDFIICDEAHKVPDLVQHHFSPRIDTDDLGFLSTLEAAAQKNGTPLKISVSDIKQTAKIMHLVEKPEDVMKCFLRYEKQLSVFTNFASDIREASKKMKDKKPVAKYLSAGNIARECHCKVSDYIKIVKEYGYDSIVKTSEQDADGEFHISLQCAYESKMVKKYLHDQAPNELMLSATIGNLDIYKDMIGESDLDDMKFKGFAVPSTFDFSKSPIYFNNKYRMSYSEKAKAMPLLINDIIDICRKHPKERGLIQVTSYDISKAVISALPPDIKSRLVYYTDSKEKAEALSRMKNSINKILIGCSLWEGLDFKDDLARFLIVAKMPYASLGDKLVRRKMDLIPGYYQNDVCQKLTQGIGRIVRSPTDWGITYILDGCFTDVFRANKDVLPKEGFVDRVQEYK